MKRFLLANYPAPIQKALTSIIQKAFLDAEIRITTMVADHLDQLDIKNPDLLILDFAVNNNDGMILLKQVKDRYPGLPVLIITACRKITDAVAAFNAGADGLLCEGAAFSELALAARTILGGEKYIPVALGGPLHLMKRGSATPTVMHLQKKDMINDDLNRA
ncbi:MAG: response regulator [Chitinophagaceae bacterium]